MHIEVHHYHHIGNDNQSEFKQLLTELLSIATQNQTILKELQMTDQEASVLLDKINVTTNGIASAQNADVATLTEVKKELEALLAQPPATSGLSDATSAKLQLLATAVGAVQTNTSNNSVILNAIAAEGKPVVPAPPTPPVNPPTA